jgi:Coenzyme PQQ synthesis protein D (PqqD)
VVIDQNSVFGRRDRVIAQQVEGQSVLLDVDSGEYFSLNEVGGLVWDLCDGSHSVASMVDAICEQYDVESSVVLNDATELLESLSGAGLIAER